MAHAKAPGEASEAAKQFMRYVEHFSYQQGPHPKGRGLTNFTFWAGAGFSKSWEPSSPVGQQLFTLSSEQIENVLDPLALSRMFGVDSFNGISLDTLRQIIYQIDMQERYPDVRTRYIDDQNLKIIRAALRAVVVSRFEETTALNYFDAGLGKFPIINLTTQQQNIISFFRYLFARVDGSQDMVEGIRTHFITTNYDFVIETILDNVLDEDDSLFIYTYRGFTPEEVVGGSNITPVHEHWLTWHLLKINGGFEILRRGDRYVLDYSKRAPAAVRRDPPVLMLPSREQDYTDPYFQTVFPKAVRLLRDTQVLVLVGYSLPDDDALIRFILRQFAEEGEDGRNKAIFYVDPSDEGSKRAKLAEVFPALASVGRPHVFTFQGSFADFAAECSLIAGTAEPASS